jgi:hypothetical protein
VSAESILYTALNVAGVTAIVGTEMHPDYLPEKTTYPAIVYARASTEPIDSISSVHFGDFVTFTISAWAKTRTQADQAADATEVALRAAGHSVTGREAGFDPETGLMASTITAVVLA